MCSDRPSSCEDASFRVKRTAADGLPPCPHSAPTTCREPLSSSEPRMKPSTSASARVRLGCRPASSTWAHLADLFRFPLQAGTSSSTSPTSSPSFPSRTPTTTHTCRESFASTGPSDWTSRRAGLRSAYIFFLSLRRSSLSLFQARCSLVVKGGHLLMPSCDGPLRLRLAARSHARTVRARVRVLDLTSS